MKDINESLKFFANEIWKHGESKEKGCQCIIPFSFEGKKELTTYEQASKVIYNKFKATHFDRTWKDKGKTVLLRFYKGEEFGACLDIKFVDEKVVELN